MLRGVRTFKVPVSSPLLALCVTPSQSFVQKTPRDASRFKERILHTQALQANSTQDTIQTLSMTSGHQTAHDRSGEHYVTRVSSRLPPYPRNDPTVWSSKSGPLSSRMLEEYDEHGFLRLESLLSSSEVAAIRDDLEKLLVEPTLRSNPRCVLEKSSKEVRSIFEIQKLSSAVQAVIASSKLTNLARQILGTDVYIHQSRVNFKPAFTGKGFYWHSDFETWHAEDGMPKPRALSFSINLADNSTSNGPLMLISGSHKTFVSCIGSTPNNHYLQSLREQEIGVPDKESLKMLTEQAGGIEILTGPAGSAVMFDSNCMHGSCDNISPSARCNLFLVFNSIENTLKTPYYANARRPSYIAATDFTPV